MVIEYPPEDRWRNYSIMLRRQLRAALLALTVYPTVILIGVIGVAAYIRTTAGDDVGAFFLTLRNDIELSTIVIIFIGIVVVPVTATLRDRNDWYHFCSEIVRSMDSGNCLSFILAHRTCPKSTLLDEAIQAGSDPGSVLATGTCPQPIVTAFVRAIDEKDLKNRLGTEIQRYQEEMLRQAAAFERAAQPVSVGLAGVAVIWLVARVVVPYMVSRLGTGLV